MDTYESLSFYEQQAIEEALDVLKEELVIHGVKLAGDDRAARAAEALARYVAESKA